MVTALVDTSALFALLDSNDLNHAEAVRQWDAAIEMDLVTHGYVVTESIALTRARLGWDAVEALIDRILPAIRIEMVERTVHEVALAEYRAIAGGTSFVDRVTIAFGKRHGIGICFAFDADLEAAGLAPLG